MTTQKRTATHSPQDIERLGGAELFLQAGKRIRYKTFREVCNEYLSRWNKKYYQGHHSAWITGVKYSATAL
ncbi:MAG: hypothetical protein QX189_00980 [Methylococcales bacterium]